MPRVRSRPLLALRDVLTRSQRSALLSGPEFHEGAFATEAAARRAWRAHRDALMPDDELADGRRPWAFWAFDVADPSLMHGERPDARLVLLGDADALRLRAAWRRVDELRIAHLSGHGLMGPGERERVASLAARGIGPG